MNQSSSSQPIGIFDSGIGGLVVTRAVTDLLPREDIIYFGDTAHLPYGDKSASSIREWSFKITELLLKKNCKLILIACNSASSAAYEQIRATLAGQCMIVNVIDPVIHVLESMSPQVFPGNGKRKIGLIGTRQTVNSGVFQHKINSRIQDVELIQHPTNLLASAIEEFGIHPVTDCLLETYLSDPALNEIDTLILACTHYPVIRKRIENFYTARQRTVNIIDPSAEVAKAVARQLSANRLDRQTGSAAGKRHFYVSDYTESFATRAKTFFDSPITLEHLPLWEEAGRVPA